MANIFHRIKAYLYPNRMTEDPNDLMAIVSSERSLGIADICQSAVTRGTSDGSSEAMEHNVRLFFKEMEYQLCDGYSVNTDGYFTAGAKIHGTFHSATDKFDRAKHSLYFQFNQGEILRNDADTIEVDLLGLADIGASIVQVTDIKTGSVNSLLTPNRNLKINGYKLKLAGDNSAVGIYFVNQSTGERTKVDASDIVSNNPSELMIIIPELATGEFTLEVHTQFAGSNLLKEPRMATFEKTLSVQ